MKTKTCYSRECSGCKLQPNFTEKCSVKKALGARNNKVDLHGTVPVSKLLAKNKGCSHSECQAGLNEVGWIASAENLERIWSEEEELVPQVGAFMLGSSLIQKICRSWETGSGPFCELLTGCYPLSCLRASLAVTSFLRCVPFRSVCSLYFISLCPDSCLFGFCSAFFACKELPKQSPAKKKLLSCF